MEAAYGQFFLSNLRAGPHVECEASEVAKAEGALQLLQAKLSAEFPELLLEAKQAQLDIARGNHWPHSPEAVVRGELCQSSLGETQQTRSPLAVSVAKAASASTGGSGESPEPAPRGNSSPRTAVDQELRAAGEVRLTNGIQGLSGIDRHMAQRLDAFFGNESDWERVALEVAERDRHQSCRLHGLANRMGTFRVCVPKPYPGLQYRKSFNLQDKYPRYADNGSEVTGQVDDTGMWLRVAHDAFLPTRVGTIVIMEPLVDLSGEAVKRHGPWSCCPAKVADAAMVAEPVLKPYKAAEQVDACMPTASPALGPFPMGSKLQ